MRFDYSHASRRHKDSRISGVLLESFVRSLEAGNKAANTVRIYSS